MKTAAIVPCTSPRGSNRDYQDTIGEVIQGLASIGVQDSFLVDLQAPIPKHDVAILLVLGGGSEPVMFRFLQQTGKPVIALALPSGNALPAALDVISIVRANGRWGSIVQMTGGWQQEMQEFLIVLSCYQAMQDSRIGVIGVRDVEVMSPIRLMEKVKATWGPQLVYIGIDELVTSIQAVRVEEVTQSAEELMQSASGVVEPDFETAIGAAQIYFGLRKIVERYQLDAVTVKCFDLLPVFQNTGCYAIARLNEEGIPAGCESDVLSCVGMLLLKNLVNLSSFMANPVMIDLERGVMLAAHCTIARDMTESYVLRSHLESNLGIGIQGHVEQGPATVFRIGGRDLKEVFVTNAAILEGKTHENMCRTQLKVKIPLSSNPRTIITNPLGNHHLLVVGDWEERIKKYLSEFVVQ